MAFEEICLLASNRGTAVSATQWNGEIASQPANQAVGGGYGGGALQQEISFEGVFTRHCEGRAVYPNDQSFGFECLKANRVRT